MSMNLKSATAKLNGAFGSGGGLFVWICELIIPLTYPTPHTLKVDYFLTCLRVSAYVSLLLLLLLSRFSHIQLCMTP